MLDVISVKEKSLYAIDRAAFSFFAILMFFLPISNAAIESSFGFIFLCFILKCLLKGKEFEWLKLFNNKINLLLLVFYLLIGLSLLESGPLFVKSFRAWFFKWGQGFLLFYFAQYFLKRRHIKFLLIPLFVSTFLVCIYGLYQLKFNIIKGFSLLQTDTLTGIRSTFNHYNDFASFLVVICFINFGILLRIKRFWIKLILGILALLIIINILLTYSRGGWLAFTLTSFIYGFILYKKEKSLNFIYYILVSVFILAIFWIPSLTERFFVSFATGGDSERFKIWRISFLIFKDYPFLGKGIGLYMDYLTKYAHIAAEYAHNCYLQILVETGLLGLFSFLLFLGEIIVRGFIKIIKDFNDLFLGLFSGLLAFLIHSFFDTQLYSLKLSILFWLLAAFVTIYLIEPQEEQEQKAISSF